MTKAERITKSALKINRALILLMEAREALNEAGAYEDDTLFLATSNLTDAIAATGSACTSVCKGAFQLVQSAR